MNRVDRTTDETIRVHARAATARDEVFVEPQAVADQPRDTVMRIGAGFGAFVASRATFEVQDEQALGEEETLFEEILGVHFLQILSGLGIATEQLTNLAGHRFSDFREGADEFAEVFATNADQFDVVERRTGRRSGSRLNVSSEFFSEFPSEIGE